MTENLKRVGDELMSFFGSLDCANWTDAQWADHDAKIAADSTSTRECTSCKKPHASYDNVCDQCGVDGRVHDRGFPLRAIEAARAADETASAIVRVREWSPSAEGILVLSGPPGCGKTVAATWWALNGKHAPRFVRATAFATASRYQNDERDSWLAGRSLVLDDLGTEYADSKGSFLVDLDELVDTFYADKKPLVITTNCTAAEFKKRYGERVTDRIRECGSWFSISDVSRRRKAP